MMPILGLTAVIRRGERQYVAMCPELDVVTRGPTFEDALTNLKEAAEPYLDEVTEAPEGVGSGAIIVTHFEVATDAKASGAVRARTDPGAGQGWL
jgi:predicted RNase H-like HicB family nuclease